MTALPDFFLFLLPVPVLSFKLFLAGPTMQVAFTSVSAGGRAIALLASDGRVFVEDASGRLAALPLPGPATAVSCSSTHLLLLLADGRAFSLDCTAAALPSPVDTGSPLCFTAIAAGAGFSLCLAADGTGSVHGCTLDQALAPLTAIPGARTLAAGAGLAAALCDSGELWTSSGVSASWHKLSLPSPVRLLSPDAGVLALADGRLALLAPSATGGAAAQPTATLITLPSSQAPPRCLASSGWAVFPCATKGKGSATFIARLPLQQLVSGAGGAPLGPLLSAAAAAQAATAVPWGDSPLAPVSAPAPFQLSFAGQSTYSDLHTTDSTVHVPGSSCHGGYHVFAKQMLPATGQYELSFRADGAGCSLGIVPQSQRGSMGSGSCVLFNNTYSPWKRLNSGDTLQVRVDAAARTLTWRLGGSGADTVTDCSGSWPAGEELAVAADCSHNGTLTLEKCMRVQAKAVVRGVVEECALLAVGECGAVCVGGLKGGDGAAPGVCQESLPLLAKLAAGGAGLEGFYVPLVKPTPAFGGGGVFWS